MSTYTHQTKNRLRVRSDFILDNPEDVAALVADIEKVPAITEVKHRRFSGSVTICFNDSEIDMDSLLEMVESHGWLKDRQRNDFVENAVRQGSKTLLKGVAVVALQQLVGASVVRMLSTS